MSQSKYHDREKAQKEETRAWLNEIGLTNPELWEKARQKNPYLEHENLDHLLDTFTMELSFTTFQCVRFHKIIRTLLALKEAQFS